MSNESRDTEQMRVSKSPLEIVLLDDMGSMLHRLIELQEQTIPQGSIEPAIIPLLPGGVWFQYKTQWNPWFTFVITNDGPGVVEFNTNTLSNRSSTINAGETLRFDFGRAVVQQVYLRIVSGASAQIRLYGTY